MKQNSYQRAKLWFHKMTPEEFEERWRRYILFEYIPELCSTVLWIIGVCFSLLLLFGYIMSFF